MQYSGSDLAEKVVWLERILREVDAYGLDLWASPYADMLKLPVVLEAYRNALEEHLPQGIETIPSFLTRRVLVDLIQLEKRAKQNADISGQWSATLLSCLLTIKDMEHGGECEAAQELLLRCNDLLEKATHCIFR